MIYSSVRIRQPDPVARAYRNLAASILLDAVLVGSGRRLPFSKVGDSSDLARAFLKSDRAARWFDLLDINSEVIYERFETIDENCGA